MATISQETFDKFSEEEKEKIRDDYQKMLDGKTELTEVERNGAVLQMEWLVGKENLQPKPMIKTWEDVINMYPEYLKDTQDMTDAIAEASPDLFFKMLATYQIAKLIELGYGGIIRDEEWKDDSINKFSIVCEGNNLTIDYLPPNERHFISFHYVQQAEEFLSYSSNKKLVELYYMI